eukprot:11510842-Ditylum_brightwellii.AAC.1
MMTGKKEIAIVLVIKASHIMWKKSVVTLAPNPKATAIVAAALQATAAPILALCQMAVNAGTTTTMWRTPTWTWMMKMYLHLVTLIQPSSV